MPWPQTGAIYYHTQLGQLDIGRVIKGAQVSFLSCGEDGYRDQVPQHPIETTHNNLVHKCFDQTKF